MHAAEIANQFQVEGHLFNVEALPHGNVNDTYLVIKRTVFSETQFVLQRINQRVFKEPEKVMKNIHVVTEFVHMVYEREYDESDRIWQLPRVIPSKDGRDFYLDEDGNMWRAITKIASAHAYEKIHHVDHAYEVGAVLGKFHHAIAELPVTWLHDTLPGFHITPQYFQILDQALTTEEGRRRLNSSKTAANVLTFLEQRREWCQVLEKAKERGELKIRPIHGDPKTGNIMIDDVSNKGTSIIDLDTVKGGLIHYDIGDCLRSSCNPMGEETRDFTSIVFNLDYCEALLRGYRSQSKDAFTDADRQYLYDAVRLIAFEQALRFFADYLAGDVYYKIREEGQNLLRARVQTQLCRSIEAREMQIRKLCELL